MNIQEQLSLAFMRVEYDLILNGFVIPLKPTKECLNYLQKTYTILKPYYKNLRNYKEIIN